MVRGLQQIWILLWKDLMIDLRRKENILAMVFFSLLTLLMFQFAIGGGQDVRFRLTPRAVERLEREGLSQRAVAAVGPLMGAVHSTQGAFLAALNGIPDWRPTGSERIAILQASRRSFVQESAPGLLWVMFLLAGMLGLSKSFTQEKENACMDGLLLTPVSRGVLYLGKMGSNALFLIVLLALVLPMFSIMFQIPVRGVLLPLCLVLLAGVLGFSALGTLLGGITSTLRGKEILLPLLLFPLIAPVLIVVVHLTGVILEGEALSQQVAWIRLLVGADLVFLIISYLVFDYVMET
jgi:heme exporter protein B